MKTLAKILIRIYQWCIRPVIGDVCKFTPSCSNYALEALEKHGFFQGTWLTTKRICRCNPWSCSGGHDPVP